MLQLQQLNSGYGDTTVLRDINMKIEAGQVVCLLGRNGVGKTTLLKTIMGVLSATEGSIQLKEQDVTKKNSTFRARSGMGYVPQGREIFSQLTVKENLLLGLEPLHDTKAKLPGIIYEYFPVLHEIAERRGGDLSGGQQQQLAIARALASNPDFLLLDEPTEGIQPNIVSLIQQVIRELKEANRCSILLVEHNFDFARSIGDYFYILDNGRIVFEGTVNDVKQEEMQKYLSF